MTTFCGPFSKTKGAKRIACSVMVLTALSVYADEEPLRIDLTSSVPAAVPVNLGQGTNKNPDGHFFTADGRSLMLDGKRIIPVVGEFHYSRYPASEWRDELLKMKAGGVTVVSTYVFWIHHEEEQGKFDWSDRKSLRDFLKLCHEVGLLAIVRMGPWVHGEVRNGGFPDWAKNSGVKLRTVDPAFLNLVRPYYQQVCDQMKGLLWKDGGPVIGVQMDNECNNLPYLFALKKMAQEFGVDVPFYTMTGWNRVAIPTEGLLPLFGAYAVNFWGGSLEESRKGFIFYDSRDNGDLGAQTKAGDVDRSREIARFPYACCEIGAGMTSSYNHRVKIVPEDIAALALVKIGSGSNMQGYYMYHGGINPDGALSSLNEEKPNPLPFKDYDFQAPLGACGEVRDHYHLLLEQHLFLHDFGPALAQTIPLYPDIRPRDLKDSDTLRWCVRWDGQAGFLFFNNCQPTVPMSDHTDVQFALKSGGGTTLIPSQPITVANGSYGIWPINLDCDGVKLDYATAQPLCRLQDGNAVWYFFAALKGIPAELSFTSDPSVVTAEAGEKKSVAGHVQVQQIKPGLNCAAHVATTDGGSVNFVVLSPEQAGQFYRVSFAGKDRAILTDAAIMQDGADIRLQAIDSHDLKLAMFPSTALKTTSGSFHSVADGIFTRLTPAKLAPHEKLDVTISQTHPAGANATSLKGMDDATWNDAAVYEINIPPAASGLRAILKIHYIGDAAQIYVGDHLFNDNFYNGDAFSIALWRIPADQWPHIRLKILPYSDVLAKRLPKQAIDAVATAKAANSLDKVEAEIVDQQELTISP